MFDAKELVGIITKARERAEKRKFGQSVDVITTLRDIDVKKGFQLNELVTLPHRPSKGASVCVVASSDLALRAKKANVDRVIEPDELEKVGTSKKDAKKLARQYDFFLADTALMPAVGKTLGPYLGPRGKMAAPIPYNAPIESILDRFKASVRIRTRAQLQASCKIGDESLNDQQLAENAMAVIGAVEKKLPNGEKNLKDVMIKFTMGKVAKLAEAKVA